MIRRKLEEKASNNVWWYLILEEVVINLITWLEKCGRRNVKCDDSLDGEVTCEFPCVHFRIF